MLPIYTRKKLDFNSNEKLRDLFFISNPREKRHMNGSSLSGGQQQQLAIARALILTQK